MSAILSVDVGKALDGVDSALKNKPPFTLHNEHQAMFDKCVKSYFVYIRLLSTYCLKHRATFEYVYEILPNPTISSGKQRNIVEKRLIDENEMSNMISELQEIVNKLQQLQIDIKELLHVCKDYPEYKNEKTTKWTSIVLGTLGIAIGIALIAVPGAAPFATPLHTVLFGGGIAISGTGVGVFIDGVTGAIMNKQGLSNFKKFLNGIDKGAAAMSTAADNHFKVVSLFNNFHVDGMFNTAKLKEMCETFDILLAMVDSGDVELKSAATDVPTAVAGRS